MASDGTQCPSCARAITYEFRTLCVPLPESRVAQFSLGRNPKSDIVVSGRGISWDHASLIVDRGGGIVLQDLGSSNGTFLNSHATRVESAFLRQGDTLYLGDLPVAVDWLLLTVARLRRGGGA